MFNPQATNEVMGMTQYFGGALNLAEVMSPDVEAVKILGDEEKSLWSEIFICTDCFCKDFNIAQLIECINEKKELEET